MIHDTKKTVGTRLLSILLVLVMLVGLLPLSVFATSTGYNVVYDSGAAGVNATGMPFAAPTDDAADFTVAAAPSWDGHTFVHWKNTKNNDILDAGTVIGAGYFYGQTEDITFVAIWSDFVVSYDLNGGNIGGATTVTASKFMPEGTLILPAAPAQDGKIFAGWKNTTTNAVYMPGQTVALDADVTYQAQWAAYTTATSAITFDFAGGSADITASTTVMKGSNFVVPAVVPTLAGNTFVSWTMTQNAADTTGILPGTTVAITADTTFTATYVAATPATTATLSFADGATAGDTVYGIPSAVTLVVGEKYTAPAAPAYAGHYFKGWKLTSTSAVYQPGEQFSIAADDTLTAQWDAVTLYTVSYDVNGGEGVFTTQSLRAGDVYVVPSYIPVKDGSTFSGWEDAATVLYAPGANIIISENITLTAQWTAETTYDITFDLDGGVGTFTNFKAVKNDVIVLSSAIPTKEGFVFAGWFDGVNTYGAGSTVKVTDNLALTALWTAEETVTVSYAAGTGATVYGMPANGTFVKNSTIVLPEAPTCKGYYFAGWKSDETTPVTYGAGQNVKVSANITFTAQWTAIPTYTVSFNLDGGKDMVAPTATVYNEGTVITLPSEIPTAPVDSMEFMCWNDGTNNYPAGSSYKVNGTVVIKAVYKDRDTWVIHQVTSTPTGMSGAMYYCGSASTLGNGNYVAGLKGEVFTLSLTVAPEYAQGVAPSVAIATTAGPQILVGSLMRKQVNFTTGAVAETYVYSFTPTSNASIMISSLPKARYTVSLPIGDFKTTLNGAPNKSTKVDAGSAVGFTLKPNYGTENVTVFVNGIVLAPVSTGADGTMLFSISDIYQNTTVTVECDEDVSYPVVYMVQTGTETEVYQTQYVLSGAKATKPVPPAVDGYTFIAWRVIDAHGPNYDFNTPVTAPVTLFAYMEPVTSYVTYEANSPDGTDANVTNMPTPSPEAKVFGTPYVISATVPTYTPNGYKFLGWALNKDATTPDYIGGDALSAKHLGDVSLYAVWEKITFTVTVPDGEGYTVWAEQSKVVDYNKDFTFYVREDVGYTENIPTVNVNGAPLAATGDPILNADGSKTFKYVINNILEDKYVSIYTGKNKLYRMMYNLSFFDGSTFKGGRSYFTTYIEWNHKAENIVAPEVEGYEFQGWYKDPLCHTVFDFNTPITANTEIYAKMVKKVLELYFAADGAGYDLSENGAKDYKYGEQVLFTVDVATGYTAKNMKVSYNGFELAPYTINKIGTDSYRYCYFINEIKEGGYIDVIGVERATVNVTYDNNHGFAGPINQTVNYYLTGATDNTELAKEPLPTRLGYNFVGWSVDPEDYNDDGILNALTADGLKGAYTAAEIDAGVEAQFTDDVVLYAIWTEKTTAITLETDKASYYEDEAVILTANVTYVDEKGNTVPVTSGKIYFYQNGKLIGNCDAVGGGAKISAVANKYEAYEEFNFDYYEAVYYPMAEEGFEQAQTSAYIDFTPSTLEITEIAGYTPALTTNILSRSISWPMNRTSIGIPGSLNIVDYYIINNSDVITITDRDGHVLTGDERMQAQNTYTLSIGSAYALVNAYNDVNTGAIVNTPLVIGKDYKIIWQYKDGTGDWKTYTESYDSNEAKVTPEYSKYVFRAVIEPLGEPTSVFTTAAKYTEITAGNYRLVNGETTSVLISKPTAETVKKNSYVKITSDKTEYAEGEEITLTVVATRRNALDEPIYVNSGIIYVYQNGVLIHSAEAKGGAVVLKTKASSYNPMKTLEDNVDRFEAVFVPVDDESLYIGYTNSNIDFDQASATISFLTGYAPELALTTKIDSRAITWALDRTAELDLLDLEVKKYEITDKANTIDIADVEKLAALADTYTAIDGDDTIVDKAAAKLAADAEAHPAVMAANRAYTLSIKPVYALTWGYTDVADGTAVAYNKLTVAKDYYVTWQYKNDHGDWVDYTTIYDADDVLVTPEYSKYQFRALVFPMIGDTTIYTKAAEYIDGKLSITRYTNALVTVPTAETILNSVKVVVSAKDEIAATADVDVYQGNTIELTAVVTADADPVKPEGTVTFYYVDEDGNEVKLETLALIEDGNATDGYKYQATLATDVLPVLDNGTYQKLEIYAIYTEDDTFAEKDSRDDLESADDACIVYVRASVINVDTTKENLINHDKTKGNIYITVDGTLNPVSADDYTVLRLSDIYTRDVLRGDEVVDDVKLLTYGDNYTVQWQKLTNWEAFLEADGTVKTGIAANEVPWTDIAGANGTSCSVTIEEGSAYRAVVTAVDTKATTGSYTEVDTPYAGLRTYYSNILVPTNGEARFATYINSSIVDDAHKGVVEGETVLVNTFATAATDTPVTGPVALVIFKTDDNGMLTSLENIYQEATVNGYASIEWNPSVDGNGEAKDVNDIPGFYYVAAGEFANSNYDPSIDYAEIIVRDDNYTIAVDDAELTQVYDGKTKSVEATIEDMNIMSDLAQESYTISYYPAEQVVDNGDGTKDYGEAVEPRLAGEYAVVVTLAESKYWTEKTAEFTLVIEKREVEVVDLVSAAKIYNGQDDANVVEIMLGDAVTDQVETGLPMDDKGLINGDIVYVVAEGYTTTVNAGDTMLGIRNATLAGPDAANYELVDYSYTEAFRIERNQLHGEIVANIEQVYSDSGRTFKNFNLYDAYGTKIENPTIIYYYHTGEGVEKVDKMVKRGVYTVIVTMDQNNYKGGLSVETYIGETKNDVAATMEPAHTVVTFQDTVTIYNAAGNTPITAVSSLASATVEVYYYTDAWTTDVPANAGRYLVKAVASTGDVFYGLYTVLKANPDVTISADDAEYTSAPTNTAVVSLTPDYFTFAGDTVKGAAQYNAPTEVGTYVVTAHYNETENYAEYEISTTFDITPATLFAAVVSMERGQYRAYNQFMANYAGFVGYGVSMDTVLNSVQIEPEIVFNMTDGVANFDNDALDQVGKESLTILAGLAKNYTFDYADGAVYTTALEPEVEFHIATPIDYVTTYGDEFKLYTVGNRNGVIENNSSVYEWTVTPDTDFIGTVTVDNLGYVEVYGVGQYTVTVTRGYGAQQITASYDFVAQPQEVTLYADDEDFVFTNTEHVFDTTTFEASNMFKVDPNPATVVNDQLVFDNTKRTNIESQLVSAYVNTDTSCDETATTTPFYCSEEYYALLTVNDKDVTVTPVADTTEYGTKTNEATRYTESGNAGTLAILTNGWTVTRTDAYNNLDTGSALYEILVAGRENMNYNVKFETNSATERVTVTPKEITVTSGVYSDLEGRTLITKTAGKTYTNKYNPDNPAKKDYRDAAKTFTVDYSYRMFGENNKVVAYRVTDFISGDSMADLLNYNAFLFKYYNLVDEEARDGKNDTEANANVTYPNRATATATEIASRNGLAADYYTVDNNETMVDFKNYTVTYVEGTEYIYQRPVTLKVYELDGTDPLPGNVELHYYYKEHKDVLTKLLLEKLLKVQKYSGEGGLATNLDHTIYDLNLEITYVDLSTYKTEVHVKVLNENYWLSNGTQEYVFEIDFLKYSYIVDYDDTLDHAHGDYFGQSSAQVTLFRVDGVLDGYINIGTTLTAAYLPNNDVLYCYIYREVKDGDYSRQPTVVETVFHPVEGKPGVYTANYKLSSGRYCMFAVTKSDVYTLINDKKH